MSKAGLDPDHLDVILTTGGDFLFSIQYFDATGTVADWPAGTAWSIVFGNGDEWAATVTGSLAAWDVDKAVADLVPAGTSASWRYVNGSTDIIYYLGKVHRRG